MKPGVWFVSELYYPEETSTGYFLTGIAEAVAADCPVGVICGRPTYSARAVAVPSSETRNGVAIVRVRNTRLNPAGFAPRLLNALTISVAVFFKVLTHVRRGNLVVVVTNPPLLPLVARLATRLRGARCVLLVHDVYPEVLVATGVVKGRFASRLLTMMFRPMYRGFERIVVIGRDMRDLVQAKVAGAAATIALIPNWGDSEEIRPQRQSALRSRLGLDGRFVVQYMGNIGRTHGVGVILSVAQSLLDDPAVHFLIIGSGSRKGVLEREVVARRLTNVTFLPPVPRADLADAMSAADVALIAFEPGMRGVSVPSRMYNVLASGRPIIAVAEPQSELALVVAEEEAGWRVDPGDSAALADAIRRARSSPAEVEQRGRSARAAAERRYSRSVILQSWRDLIRDLR